MKNKIFKVIIPIILILLIILITSTYSIDLKRMERGIPIIFWNWGYAYCAIGKISDLKLEITPSNNNDIVKINLKNNEYDIYYYGIESINIKYILNYGEDYKENVAEELLSLLEEKKIAIENIIDRQEGFTTCEMYVDGKSKKYTDENCCIIIDYTTNENKSIYFGLPTMQFEDVI